MEVMKEPFFKGVLVMFDRSWIGYPCPSLVECLIVFAILFVAGSLWASCIRCYVEYRMEEKVHA
jgi:hypothetical protein